MSNSVTPSSAYTTSRGIKKDKLIKAAMQIPVSRNTAKAGTGENDIIVGWGQKDNTKEAQAIAQKKSLPYVRLEDGFIGYLSHPEIDDRRVSLIQDRCGIYYDASGPSDLENLLNNTAWLTDQLKGRAQKAMARIRQWKISKYNQATLDLNPETQALIDKAKAAGKKITLLIDQTYGDKGIELGLAGEVDFQSMYDDALSNHPNDLILIKTHPDVLLGKKKGCLNLDKEIALDRNVNVITDNVAPMVLLEQVDHVYTVTSQMGFEGLLAGKKVTVYGMPFYAGWGLTTDKMTCVRRNNTVTLTEMFAAAFIKYTRYVCPFSAQATSLEQILDYLVADKQMPRLKASRIIAVDFSLWKKGFIDHFVQGTNAKIIWLNRKKFQSFKYKAGDAVLVWGRKFYEQQKGLPDFVQVWRIEDGFLRSIGLGSDLRRPASLVLEKMGMYYDATKPSQLEIFLGAHEFSSEDRMRGAAFIASMRAGKLSKYNVGKPLNLNFDTGGKEIALVTGQVEGDASLALGSPKFQTNRALLKAVRKNNPDSFIIYKAHPDVLGGNRAGAVPKESLHRFADAVVDDVDIQDCLKLADSVHVMTSGSGLEALLMGKNVHCYGMPFYAGWGVTTDQIRNDRRKRALTIEEIIYAAYIVYPTYVSWPLGKSSCAESLIEDIQKAKRKSQSVEVTGLISKCRSYLRKAKYLLEALLK